MIPEKVNNKSVWKSIRIIFISAAVLFLINIYFGFENSLAGHEIPRARILIHLHAGTLGWITLSAVGLAIWALTGNREVSPKYERNIRMLTWAAVIIFGGYIPNFWLAFSREQGWVLNLLPIFGSGGVLILWWAAIFAIRQWRKQDPLSTVQLLISGGLFVAAVGSTIGALLGLENVIGQFLPLPQNDRVGAHAGMMDSYLFLVASAVIEWFTRENPHAKWTPWSLIQTLAWVVGAALVPIAFFTNSVQQIVPFFGLLLIFGMLVFLIRTAWRAVLAGPTADGGKSWVFFGTLWLVIYMLFFIYFASQVGSGTLPHWYGAVFNHSGYIGMMTNLLLAVYAARSSSSSRSSWGEPLSRWLINIGLLTFFATMILGDSHLGAIVMGIGVLLGVITMLSRLFSAESNPGLEME